MKSVIRIVVIVVALLLSSNVHAQIQHDLKCIIDTVLHKAKQTALNAHGVKWDSVKLIMYQKAENAKSINDLKASFEYLLITLDDRHGKFINAKTNSSIATYTGDLKQISPDVLASANSKFEFKVLEGGIGYLKIVNIAPEADVQKEAEIIRSAIDSLEKGEPQRWIIDLRNINGGSINPIIAGIGPLLGEGQVGGIIDGKNKVKELFEVHNGNFYDDWIPVAKFPCTKGVNNSKIAVLIGHNTAGTGEVVGITLKGRKNTRFFGEPTAGHLSVTNKIHVGKDIMMSITEGLIQDRIGNPYKDNLEPDKLANLQHAITEAIEWLNFEPASEKQLASN